jgi:hypothetical protein
VTTKENVTKRDIRKSQKGGYVHVKKILCKNNVHPSSHINDLGYDTLETKSTVAQ